MAENISCEKCNDCIRCSLGLICGASRNKSKVIPSRPTIYGLIPYCDIPEWCPKAERSKEAEKDERDKYGETKQFWYWSYPIIFHAEIVLAITKRPAPAT